MLLPLEQRNTITADWLVLDSETGELVPFVSNMHGEYNAVHQWLSIDASQPFAISFIGRKELCLFLNNRLIFRADSAANYTVDIKSFSTKVEPVDGKYLLTAWHPVSQPNISTIKNKTPGQGPQELHNKLPFSVRARDFVNQNAFILFVLLLGLMYGGLKTSFTSDFSSLYSFSSFFRRGSLEEGFFARPISSWSSVLFVVAFSLSFALLIAAIHTNVQHLFLFNRLFPVSEADITTKIVFYTLLIFVFILLKYLFLKVMGYIFGFDNLVPLQYSEFVRTILFLGMFLPVVMLLYLGLNQTMPDTVLLISNFAVLLLLGITTLRVFLTVNKKLPVLNLHLFSYLCATEVIPLAIMLKLIVFSF
nr:DUF4271 domain-containing protein [Pontibacter harenae]